MRFRTQTPHTPTGFKRPLPQAAPRASRDRHSRRAALTYPVLPVCTPDGDEGEGLAGLDESTATAGSGLGGPAAAVGRGCESGRGGVVVVFPLCAAGCGGCSGDHRVAEARAGGAASLALALGCSGDTALRP